MKTGFSQRVTTLEPGQWTLQVVPQITHSYQAMGVQVLLCKWSWHRDGIMG